MPPITTKMIDKICETVEDSKQSPKKNVNKKVSGRFAFKKQPSTET